MLWIGAFGLCVLVAVAVSRARRPVVVDTPVPGAAPPVSGPCERPTAIELGIAILTAMREADDGEIGDALERLGVSPWLARRLVVWIPMAFAQRVLATTTLIDDYDDRTDVRKRMSEDPVYRDATRYAADLAPEAALSLAERSAVMNATRRHTQTTDMAALAALGGQAATALLAPLPPVEANDGGVPEVSAAHAALVAGRARDHGLALDGWAVRHRFAAVLTAQFDFVVRDSRLEGGKLVESHAGHATTFLRALGDALDKHQAGSLPVILATLVDEAHGGDRVTWEDWELAAGAFRVCIGKQLVLWNEAPTVDVSDLVQSLRAALATETLSRRIHTLRVFASRDGRRSLADEVLLDGEPWPAGEALCAVHTWPDIDEVWAVRCFMMLLPPPTH